MITDLLKDQTRSQHERLERLNGLPSSRAHYVAQLVAFFGFVQPWESEVARVLPEEDPVRHGRAKTAWLVEDLRHFGYDAPGLAALPRATTLPSTRSRAAILGAAYVLEGSTLGGRFIARHLDRVPGLEDGAGRRYFSSYGDRVPEQWQAFRTELLRASTPDSDPVIVAGARQAFEHLHAWFETQKAVAA